MRQKKLARLSIFLRVMMALCAAGIVYFAVSLRSAEREYAQGDAVYAQLRQEQRVQLVTDADKAPEQVADFAALRKINSDTVAWLRLQDGIIDYPIVQGQDNDYYLTHLFTGQRNKLGALFADYRTAADFSGKMSMIYGHNMKDGSMFAPLMQYRDQAYYESHPVMQLQTEQGNYTLALFAGIVGNGAKEFVPLDFSEDAQFLAYISEVKAASTFESTVSVEASDRIVALITCSYAFDNARYVLFGKLVPAA